MLFFISWIDFLVTDNPWGFNWDGDILVEGFKEVVDKVDTDVKEGAPATNISEGFE